MARVVDFNPDHNVFSLPALYLPRWITRKTEEQSLFIELHNRYRHGDVTGFVLNILVPLFTETKSMTWTADSKKRFE